MKWNKTKVCKMGSSFSSLGVLGGLCFQDTRLLDMEYFENLVRLPNIETQRIFIMGGNKRESFPLLTKFEANILWLKNKEREKLKAALTTKEEMSDVWFDLQPLTRWELKKQEIYELKKATSKGWFTYTVVFKKVTRQCNSVAEQQIFSFEPIFS